MSSIYQYCQISRQAHFKALKHSQSHLDRIPLYEALIDQTRGIHPGMSLRKIYQRTQPEGIGRDAFIKLGFSLGYRLKTIINRTRTTLSVKSSRYHNLLIGKRFTDVNQLWSSDLTYFQLDHKFIYLVFIIDVYSRRIIGYSIAKDMRATHCVDALKMAFETRATTDFEHNLIHHSDRGSQYISNAYTELLAKYKVKISMCDNVYENAHIERVNGTIKNQYLYRWKLKTFDQVSKKLRQAVDAYNSDRQHDSLEGMTPVEFENYIKELKVKPTMKIYTVKKSRESQFDPDQLVINFKP